MSDLTITVAEEAQNVIRKCERQAEAIEAAWRHVDPELAVKAHVTLSRQLARLLHSGFGDKMEIYRDGDLSLYVTTPTIVFGMIFHRAIRADEHQPDDVRPIGAPLLGRLCMHKADDTYCRMPVRNGKPTCEGHQPIIYAYPIPGEWSFHS